MPTELEKMMADLKATSDQIESETGSKMKEAQASASKTVAPHVQGYPRWHR